MFLSVKSFSATLIYKVICGVGSVSYTHLTYNKTFTAGKTTFSADSDGHTTAPESGYYGTNPNNDEVPDYIARRAEEKTNKR